MAYMTLLTLASSLSLSGATVLQDARQDQPRTYQQPSQQDRNAPSANVPELKNLQKLAGAWRVTVIVKDAAMNNTIRDQDSPTGTQPRPDVPGTQAQTKTMTGHATRRWDINGNALVERIQLTGSTSLTPGHDATQARPTDTNHYALAVFAYNTQDDKYEHVWVDSHNAGITCSGGSYSESTRTFTFTPMDQPDYGSPSADPAQRRSKTVQLRIISDDKHVVDITTCSATGADLAYTITYERASGAVRPGEAQPPDPSQPRAREVSQVTQEQIERRIAIALVSSGAESEEAADKAENLADAIVREYEQRDLQDLEGALQKAYEDCGVDEAVARVEAPKLAREIERLLRG